LIELGVSTGPLRAPEDNALCFMFQSFIDELAHKALTTRITDTARSVVVNGLDFLGEEWAAAGQRLGFQRRSRPPGARKSVRCSRLGNANCPSGPVKGRFSITASRLFSPRSWKRQWRRMARSRSTRYQRSAIGSRVINPTAAENRTRRAILNGVGEVLQQVITSESGRVAQSHHLCCDWKAHRALPIDPETLKA
jgi:isoquinoline 1-oxidoreductase subunit beta